MPTTASRLRSISELPSPPHLPVLGHSLLIRRTRFHLQLEQWAQRFGPLYRLHFIGGPPVLVVADHALFATVMRDRPETFGRTSRLRQISRELGLPAGLFSANGDSWRPQRRIVMSAFDPGHVRRYYPGMVDVARSLVKRWARSARTSTLAGSPIALQDDLMRFTVDTIAGLAFGERVDTLGSDGDVIQQHLNRIFSALYRRSLAPFPLWRYWKRSSDHELERSVEAVRAAIDSFVAGARARLAAQPDRRETPRNLLEAMIVASDLPDSGIDDGMIAGNVLTMLLAGEDTTANTLAWMIDLLWRHPDALARATHEVRNQRIDPEAGAPTLAQLAELPYIEACANEAMRLKPVAPLMPLQAHQATTIGDIDVPAKTVVIGVMRHDATSDAFVGNARRFDPTRWLADADPAITTPRHVSTPFGSGPRICPGRYLALTEIKLAMATLLRHFDLLDVSSGDYKETPERLAFTMGPVGLTMRVALRQGSSADTTRFYTATT